MLGTNKFLILIGGLCIGLVCFRWALHFSEAPLEFNLKGKIDECSSEASVLKQKNKKLQSILNELSNTTFFRIFRVNIEHDCPLWAHEDICKSLGDCSQCKCAENEVLTPWTIRHTLPISKTETRPTTWERNITNDIGWQVGDQETLNTKFIDLTAIPEKAIQNNEAKIWNAIYSKHCFSGKEWRKIVYEKGSQASICKEEELVNTLLDGIHASITTNMCEFFVREYKIKPNIPLFFHTVGDHDNKIKNLYFAYAFFMRAINRAQTHLQSYNFQIDNPKEISQIQSLMKEMYSITKTECNTSFKEPDLFRNYTKNEVREKLSQYLYNISQILDCLECETCQIYNKMQVYGLAAALKILYTERFQGESEISLKRNEVIALINTFNKVAMAMESVDKFYDRRRKNYFYKVWGIFLSSAFCVVGLWFIWKAYSQKISRGNKEDEKIKAD